MTGRRTGETAGPTGGRGGGGLSRGRVRLGRLGCCAFVWVRDSHVFQERVWKGRGWAAPSTHLRGLSEGHVSHPQGLRGTQETPRLVGWEGPRDTEGLEFQGFACP